MGWSKLSQIHLQYKCDVYAVTDLNTRLTTSDASLMSKTPVCNGFHTQTDKHNDMDCICFLFFVEL